ncbi:MAG: aminoacyl-tRNA hydrolase [Alphaproteobacteria bacterium]|nr:aminoacyl-tRNA hydrolase [Alphaproteobacteria bacterium]
MLLIVGLGNPGTSYARNRHNIGFMVVDALADTASFSKKFHGEAASIARGTEKLILLKPQTYMNLSGQSVQAAMAFHKLAPEQIIVLHDDLDLSLGKVRIKQGGGHGGHNGLRDIDEKIGKEYWRIRIGIAHPGDKDKVHDHVLSNFGKDEKPIINPVIDALADNIQLFWEHSPAALMSKLALLAE